MIFTLSAALAVAGCSSLQAPSARFTVTQSILAPAAKAMPLGANGWGGVGGVEWAANNFVQNAGNEPVVWRNLHRATNVGPNWFEIDGGGVSWFDLWGNGFLSGADVRIYRLVDKEGRPLPEKDGYLDLSKAERPVRVGTAKVLPVGSPGFPDGGWVVTQYAAVQSNSIRGTSAVDAAGVVPGRTYWYAVRALAPDGSESPFSAEVSAVPATGVGGPQFVLMPNENGVPLKAGQDIWWTPRFSGGTPPYRMEGDGPLPAGLTINVESNTLQGKPATVAPGTKIALKLTDAKGRVARASFAVAPESGAKAELAAPAGLKATALPGMVRLAWNPVPGAAGYRIYRSTAPKAKQVNRVFMASGAPKLEKWDYITVERKWLNFPMETVNTRVRGIGNPLNAPNMHWRAEPTRVQLAFAGHDAAAKSANPGFGEACLAATAARGVTGSVALEQFTMISPNIPGESLWYGQLETGKRYRAEFWLKGKGLGDGGKVTFSFGAGYADLRQTWTVGETWQKHSYEFTAPAPVMDRWHHGQRLEFTAPGTLFVDNARVFRVDRPEDAAKPYVPNRTVLDELIASQPAAGPKGAHRIWFLNRDATMDSILSWHANSRVSPDWLTSVGPTMEMTLPMALVFTEATGTTPETRMRPYLVLQHLLHSEQDWRNLMEFLAAPYDAAKDTPQTKPYAYRRFRQRGHGRPWTQTFSEIRIEFGNETWHNGVVTGDWLGFNRHGMVTQGGPEYGLFTRYLIQEIRKSPYWAAAKETVRFALGAFYNGGVDGQGNVTGYGEEAMQTNPYAEDLGHANYVGPKWETGEKAQTTYSDEGVQATLLSWVEGMEPQVQGWHRALTALGGRGRKYDLVAYEGGPSGYTLPGSAPADVVEVNERYGKSLAMAVAALDSWLGSYAYGYTDQMFLGYGQGQYWNSHTDFSRGFRSSPGWLALSLRNRAGTGDLLKVEATGVPTVTRGNKSYPGVAVYALRSGKRWSVFALSRRLSGDTPVEVRLPISAARKVTEHRLAGDPRLTNREEMKVKVETKEIASGEVRDGRLRFTLPAGSILMFELEGE